MAGRAHSLAISLLFVSSIDKFKRAVTVCSLNLGIRIGQQLNYTRNSSVVGNENSIFLILFREHADLHNGISTHIRLTRR